MPLPTPLKLHAEAVHVETAGEAGLGHHLPQELHIGRPKEPLPPSVGLPPQHVEGHVQGLGLDLRRRSEGQGQGCHVRDLAFWAWGAWQGPCHHIRTSCPVRH